MDRDETKQTSIFRLEGDCEVVLKCEPFHRKLRYLISTLRVWVINVVESIFINLPQPGMFTNAHKAIRVSFTIPPV